MTTDSYEMLRWLMQTCHRAYHADHEGLMETCPKDICLSTRQFFAERHAKDATRDALPMRKWTCPVCELAFKPDDFDPWSRSLFCRTCKLTTLTLPPANEPKEQPVGRSDVRSDVRVTSAVVAPIQQGNVGESKTGFMLALQALELAHAFVADSRAPDDAEVDGAFEVERATRLAIASAKRVPAQPEPAPPRPPEAPPAPESVMALLSGVLSTGFALRRLQKLALNTGVSIPQLDLLLDAERNVAEFAARFTPSAHEAAPDGPSDTRERLQNELNRLFERNFVENPLAGSPFAIPWAGRPPTEEELREALKAGHIWAPFVPLQITNAFPGFVEKAAEVQRISKPTRPENFNHDDKSLCPSCNLYNLKDPHKPWCKYLTSNAGHVKLPVCDNCCKDPCQHYPECDERD